LCCSDFPGFVVASCCELTFSPIASKQAPWIYGSSIYISSQASASQPPAFALPADAPPASATQSKQLQQLQLSITAARSTTGLSVVARNAGQVLVPIQACRLLDEALARMQASQQEAKKLAESMAQRFATEGVVLTDCRKLLRGLVEEAGGAF
jgi:hypothetical protein